MFTQKFTCSNFRSSYFCVLVVGRENLDLANISHYTVLHYACAMQHNCLSPTGKPVSVKQVNTRVHPMLPKLPLIPPGPNCGTWLWIIVHKAQLHCRLCIALSCTRPSFGQKPCPFCNNHSTEPSHFEHFITCHTPCHFRVYC